MEFLKFGAYKEFLMEVRKNGIEQACLSRSWEEFATSDPTLYNYIKMVEDSRNKLTEYISRIERHYGLD